MIVENWQKFGVGLLNTRYRREAMQTYRRGLVRVATVIVLVGTVSGVALKDASATEQGQ